ncbi:uncharacterized protein LOC131158604 [Malania oleifera]|uniref:uncharacterized protein LOC131158604 n=1 Tax=Malania oleifera TaxID=397392 RepID=UPI0025AECAB2|nr:uncharacterized protein LOC131158604 [Malania oleifera]
MERRSLWRWSGTDDGPWWFHGGRAAPTCPRCGRRHPGECRMGKDICYHCRRPGYISWSCQGLTAQAPAPRPYRGGYQVPRGGQQRNTTSVRVYALTPSDADAAGDIVTCATHSFVSAVYAKLMGYEAQLLDMGLAIATSTRPVVRCRRVLRRFPVTIQGNILPADLVILDTQGFEIILAIQVRKLIQEGYQGFVAYIKESSKEELKQANVPVVREFSNVFPKELPGIPPNREVEFTVDLLPRSAPVSFLGHGISKAGVSIDLSKIEVPLFPTMYHEYKNPIEEALESKRNQTLEGDALP